MSLPTVIFVLVQTDVSADGGVSSISQIIARLRHHRPVIVTDRDSGRTRQWRSAGIETHVVPQVASRGLSRDPLKVVASYARYARALRKLVRTSGAKIIHANDPAALQLSVLPAKLAGAKLVFSLRGTFDPADPPSRFKYQMLFAAADLVFYLSHDMAQRWAKHVSNADSSCSVTYSVVDPVRFRATALDAKAEPVVLVSGLIRPLKGQLEFIENVAPKLAAEGVKVQFAGDFNPANDGYMAACARAAERLGQSVEFLGYRDDISALMAKATVIAIPSHHEGMVRAMIEGMSCARPIVSFDVCSAREILEQEAGGAGIVVGCGDYGAMADSILAFCRDRSAAAEAGKMGHAASQRLFGPDEVVARYERSYAMLEAAE